MNVMGRNGLGGSTRRDTIPCLDPLVPSIFHEPWWLETATQGRVEVVEVIDNGRTVGRMPYVVSSRYGFSGSNMPTLTHFLGPGIVEGAGSDANRYVKRQAIMRELVEKLPSLSSFRQKMHRGVGDALAFQSAGFQVGVQYTFEIHPAPEAAIWKAMRDKTRNVIRRAGEKYEVNISTDADDYFRLAEEHLRTKGRSVNIDFDVGKMLVYETLERGRGHILIARDDQGVADAAILCIWDSSNYFYLMSTRSMASNNGTVPLLIWHAVRSATSMGLIFDFDGVSSTGAILFYAGFGATVSPRYVASKASLSYRLVRQIRRMRSSIVNTFE